ncbi:hypothetical protein I553_8438 [Mycobacterium xenopi 4042]|uniref:Uncharacterized protein n=1 Tax=Mycobacterium xenopi 4042 TaxID=1299334 RepID=X7ZZM3_MYCXE|nr:hypothetical protein I553_8438 [Mycobacterium xenopi 4042]
MPMARDNAEDLVDPSDFPEERAWPDAQPERVHRFRRTP